MNHIGTQYWPMRLQPSDYCEIMISCQVCWRMRRWHNGRTRRSPNPKSEIVLRDCSVNGEESAAHSILARSDPLQQRPYTFAQTNLWRPQISLAVRRRTIHRVGSARTLHRRPAEAARHQQTWELLFAKTVRARRTCGPATAHEAVFRSKCVVGTAHITHPPQRRRCGVS